MSTDLARTDLSDTPFTWNTLTAIADTEMVPRGLRGNPPAMLATIYMGRELGLGPMQSMNMIDVIDGKPSLSAELQTALLRAAGHSLLCTEWSDQAVTATGTRVDNGDEMSITFTKEMAQRAGLAGKRNWQQYPESMMWARAVSALARMLFADVFAATHTYTPDELGDDLYAPSTDTVKATAADAGMEARIEAAAVTGDAVGNVIDGLTADVVPADDPDARAIGFDVDISEPRSVSLGREALEIALVEALAPIPSDATMPEIEALRTLCRVAEQLGVVAGRGSMDYLHAALADVGAAHVGDLKRTELIRLYRSIRAQIGSAFTESLSKPDVTDAGELPDNGTTDGG